MLRYRPTVVIALLVVVVVVVCQGQKTILDTYKKMPATHCPHATVYRNGGKHMSAKFCAVLCQLCDDCAFFEWDSGNENSPCWTRDTCSPSEDHYRITTYKRLPDTPAFKVAEILDVGMHRFDNYYFYGSDVGYMENMDEDVCMFHCLLIGCKAAMWLKPSHTYGRKCHYKNGYGSLVSSGDRSMFLKAADRVCVDGFSCYVVLTKNGGMDRSAGQAACQAIDGKLAEFETQDELEALKSSGRLSGSVQGLWLGLSHSGGSWAWSDAGQVSWALPWKSGQPANVNDGVVANAPNDFQLNTLASTATTAFPLCELGADVTRKMGREQLRELCDDDDDTCFTPATRRDAASTLLETKNLLAGSTTMLVKLYGDFDHDYVHVMTRVTTDGAGGGYHYRYCEVLVSSAWSGKQFCAYQCKCQNHDQCASAFLKMERNSPTIPTICEFVVL